MCTLLFLRSTICTTDAYDCLAEYRDNHQVYFDALYFTEDRIGSALTSAGQCPSLSFIAKAGEYDEVQSQRLHNLRRSLVALFLKMQDYTEYERTFTFLLSLGLNLETEKVRHWFYHLYMPCTIKMRRNVLLLFYTTIMETNQNLVADIRSFDTSVLFLERLCKHMAATNEMIAEYTKYIWEMDIIPGILPSGNIRYNIGVAESRLARYVELLCKVIEQCEETMIALEAIIECVECVPLGTHMRIIKRKIELGLVSYRNLAPYLLTLVFRKIGGCDNTWQRIEATKANNSITTPFQKITFINDMVHEFKRINVLPLVLNATLFCNIPNIESMLKETVTSYAKYSKTLSDSLSVFIIGLEKAEFNYEGRLIESANSRVTTPEHISKHLNMLLLRVNGLYLRLKLYLGLIQADWASSCFLRPVYAWLHGMHLHTLAEYRRLQGMYAGFLSLYSSPQATTHAIQ